MKISILGMFGFSVNFYCFGECWQNIFSKANNDSMLMYQGNKNKDIRTWLFLHVFLVFSSNVFHQHSMLDGKISHLLNFYAAATKHYNKFHIILKVSETESDACSYCQTTICTVTWYWMLQYINPKAFVFAHDCGTWLNIEIN